MWTTERCERCNGWSINHPTQLVVYRCFATEDEARAWCAVANGRERVQMPRNNAAIERWAKVPVEILTLINGKVWRIAHTTVGKLADPIGGEVGVIRHCVMNSEAYMAEHRGIVTVIRLCKCECGGSNRDHSL